MRAEDLRVALRRICLPFPRIRRGIGRASAVSFYMSIAVHRNYYYVVDRNCYCRAGAWRSLGPQTASATSRPGSSLLIAPTSFRPSLDFAIFSAGPPLLQRFLCRLCKARKRNIRFIAYNTRFLILPWIQVPHLASHILSRVTATLSRDWERMYEHPIWFAETFIDPERFRGTCYRAANWVLLGRTTGRGKDDLTHRQNRSIKEVFGAAPGATISRATEPVSR